MPGINIIASYKHLAPDMATKTSAIQGRMLHFPGYQYEKVLVNQNINIGFTSYDSYPRLIIDSEEMLVAVEGLVYSMDRPALEAELKTLANVFSSSESVPVDTLKEFMLKAEGEFVLVIYDKIRNKVLLASDLLGRLPLYYYKSETLLAFSREMKFILPFMPKVAINKMGIMEYLLYGFPFEENTFFEEVGFFLDACYISYDLNTGHYAKGFYHTLNMESRKEKGKRQDIISNLKRIFLENLGNRARTTGNRKFIVSLSGGMDSRGTLAGLNLLGYESLAVTIKDSEEMFAKKTAEAIGVEIFSIEQNEPQGDLTFEKAVFLKDGLDCHKSLLQLYYNLEILKQRFGNETIYWTGIGGGEITRFRHPTGGLKSVDGLVRYLLTARDTYKYSTSQVARILQLDESEIAARIEKRLKAFPEGDIYKKYLRFRHEFDVRYASGGEDRNRFFFWTISPYFAPSFFGYVMSLDENRKDTRLFRDFLYAIDPNTCEAMYYNFSLPLNNPPILYLFSLAERLMRRAFIKTYVRLLIRLRNSCRCLVSGPDTRELENRNMLRKECLTLIEKSETVRKIFNNPELKAIVDNEEDIQGLERLQIVFTYLDVAEKWHRELTGHMKQKLDIGFVQDPVRSMNLLTK